MKKAEKGEIEINIDDKEWIDNVKSILKKAETDSEKKKQMAIKDYITNIVNICKLQNGPGDFENEEGRVHLCGIRPGEIQVYCGIEILAKALNVQLRRIFLKTEYPDVSLPYQYSFSYQGINFLQLEDTDKLGEYINVDN